MANPKSPLLEHTDNKSHISKATSVADLHLNEAISIKPSPSNTTKSASLTKSKSLTNVVAATSDALSKAAVGNYTFLQNQWTPVKHDWFAKHVPQHTTSQRPDVTKFNGVNPIFDTLRYGILKQPNLNYNPIVRTSLIRAHADRDDDDDQDEEQKNGAQAGLSKSKREEMAERDVSDRRTLPIYNGGNNVTLRKCDGNTFQFPLRQKEWSTSWLSFEVWDDKILTANDAFIGAVSIGVKQIDDKVGGQAYYSQLPLINKKNYSRKVQMAAEKKYIQNDGDSKDGKNKKQYTPLSRESDAEDYEDMDAMISDMVKSNERLNITGIVHVKATKKPSTKKDPDIFDDDKNKEWILEVEILAVTNMNTLEIGDDWDGRKFFGGIIAFVLYLFFYAGIMYLAEEHTSTGMNEYKESIWFALITVTTLGYGDIYTQTPYSKILNAFFIMINVLVIATFVGNLLGYIVDAGEETLNHRMEHMMNGVHDVFRNKEEAQQKKLKEMKEAKKKQQEKEKLIKGGSRHEKRSKSVQLTKKDINSLKNEQKDPSAPITPLSGVPENEEEKKIEEIDQEEKEKEKAVQTIEAHTKKATQLKLDELVSLGKESRKKFITQIWINIFLFFLTVLFGFFFLGVALLLMGPNFLTSLPYAGYDCDADDADPEYCNLSKDSTTVFIDSLYYTIVSMSTVGYGDIFPKGSAGARILGALFILFGTLMLVRLLDLVSSYMIWKHNIERKTKNMMKLLTSSNEFFEFDINHDGVVSKYEFLRGMLLKLDIVENDRIDEIMAIFHETDINGDGVVDRNELREKVKEDRMKLKWGEGAWKEIKRSWKIVEQEEKELKDKMKRVEKQEKELKKEKEEFEKEKINWKETERQNIRKQVEKEFIDKQKRFKKVGDMEDKDEKEEMKESKIVSMIPAADKEEDITQEEELSDLSKPVEVGAGDDDDIEIVVKEDDLSDLNDDEDKPNNQGYAD